MKKMFNKKSSFLKKAGSILLSASIAASAVVIPAVTASAADVNSFTRVENFDDYIGKLQTDTKKYARTVDVAGLSTETWKTFSNCWDGWLGDNGFKVEKGKLVMSNGVPAANGYGLQLALGTNNKSGVTSVAFDMANNVDATVAKAGMNVSLRTDFTLNGGGGSLNNNVLCLKNGKAYVGDTDTELTGYVEDNNAGTYTHYRLDMNYTDAKAYIYADGALAGEVAISADYYINAIGFNAIVDSYPDGSSIKSNITYIDNITVTTRGNTASEGVAAKITTVEDSASFRVNFSEPINDLAAKKDGLTVTSVETKQSVPASVRVIDTNALEVTVNDGRANIGGEYVVTLPEGLAGINGGAMVENSLTWVRKADKTTVLSENFDNVDVAAVDDSSIAAGQKGAYKVITALNNKNNNFWGRTNDAYVDYRGGIQITADGKLSIKNNSDQTVGVAVRLSQAALSGKVYDIEFDMTHQLTPISGKEIDTNSEIAIWYHNAMDSGYTASQMLGFKNGSVTGGGTTVENAYTMGTPFKCRIVYNLQNSRYHLYINGVPVLKDISTSGWPPEESGITIAANKLATNGSNYNAAIVDNLSVNLLPSNSTKSVNNKPAIESVRFYDKDGKEYNGLEAVQNLKKISVKFASSMTAASGIALKDSNGEAVAAETAEWTDDTTYTITFPTPLAKGQYTLTVPDTLTDNSTALARSYETTVNTTYKLVFYDAVKDGYIAPSQFTDDGVVIHQEDNWGNIGLISDFQNVVTPKDAEVVTFHYDYKYGGETGDYVFRTPNFYTYVLDAKINDESQVAGHRYLGFYPQWAETGSSINYSYGLENWTVTKITAAGIPEYLEAGKWYGFDIVYNLLTGNASYYIDGVLAATAKGGPTQIGGFGFRFTHAGTYSADEYLKNVTLFAGGEEAPVEEELQYGISMKSFGGIFYDDEIPTFTINGILDGAATVEYCIKTFDGKVVEKGSKNVTGETVDIAMSEPKYGVFNIEVSAYDSNGIFTAKADKDFSLVKTAPTNDKVGMYGVINTAKDMGNVTDIYNVFKKTGYKTLRQQFDWNSYEKTAGSYELTSGMLRTKYSATKLGFENLYILAFGNTSAYNIRMPQTDEDYVKFGEYVKNFVRDTMDENPNAVYEVWNEYNAEAFNPLGLSELDYFKLLKTSYEAVKEVNPNAKVIGMSTSGCDLDFIEKVLGFGGGNYLDGISIHPYQWSGAPTDAMFEKIQSLQTLMNENGIGEKEIWCTEIGWQTIIGKDKQAHYTTKYLLLNDAYGLVDKSVMYRYGRTYDAYPKNEEFGFIDNGNGKTPYGANPVLAATAFYNSLMNGATFAEKNEGETPLYKFNLKDGKVAVAVLDKTDALSLNLGTNTVSVFDMYGNETVLTSSDNTYTVNPTTEITYIVGDIKTVASVDSTVGASLPDNRLAEYEVGEITLSNNGGYAVDVKVSENVAVISNEADKIKFTVTDFDSAKPIIEVTFKDGSSVVLKKEFEIVKGDADNSLIYAIGKDNWTGGHQWNLYQRAFDEERENSFLFTRMGQKAANVVLTPDTFTALTDNAEYVISYDIMAEENVSFTTGYGPDYENYTKGVGLSRDGKFVYGDTVSDVSYSNNVWYRVEEVVNPGEQTAKYYIDGQKIGEASGAASTVSALKFINVCPADTNRRAVWVDAIKVRKLGLMNAEVAGNPFNENDTLTLTFSESVNNLTASDITIKNAKTGDAVTVANATKTASGKYEITIGEALAQGEEYKVELNNVTNVFGNAYSGKELSFISGTNTNETHISAVKTLWDEENAPIVITLSKEAPITTALKDTTGAAIEYTENGFDGSASFVLIPSVKDTDNTSILTVNDTDNYVLKGKYYLYTSEKDAKVYANVDMKNTDLKTGSYVLFYGVYEDGRLVGTNYKPFNYSEANPTDSIEIEGAAQGREVRVFLFETLTKLNPVAKPAISNF